MIPNILAQRYASDSLRSIWSPEGKIKLERELWVAVLKGQRDLGLDIPAEAIAAYEKVIDQIDLDSINARERVTRHDVKARIEEFCDLAGHQHIHKGMTSRDLTENVEQLQVFRSLKIIKLKTASTLNRLAARAKEFANLVITARTHNVAAQITTFGKRLAMFGEELCGSFDNLRHVITTYPVRGLKGAVGTQLDQLSLFSGNAAKVSALEDRMAAHLGLPRKLVNVGQVYPRSLDFRVISALNDLASAPSSFAKTLRLMAGHELAGEGFAEGQVGSSAMPHKMNSRSCERINGFEVILSGYLAMAARLAGDQWNEGDVSCSVVRRVMLPDAFFATDGLLDTFLAVLGQMEVNPAVIERENTHYLPFLLSTTILMAAVRKGIGREDAHDLIKKHAVAAAAAFRRGETSSNDLIDRLAGDINLEMTREELQSALDQGRANAGAAREQIAAFCEQAAAIVASVPGSESYRPGAIL